MVAPSSADTVLLHNGDRLTGTVSSVDADVLVLQTYFADEISIKRDAIQSVTTDEARDVKIDEDTLTGRLVESDGDQVVVTDDGPEPIALPDVIALTVPGTEEETGPSWSGFADAGMTMRSGNTDTIDMLLNAEATRATERTKFILRALSAYGEADDTINTRRYRGEARLQIYPRDRLFVYGLTSAERDDGRKLDWRYIVGSGVGYDWIVNDKRSLTTEAGLEYTWEEWNPFTPSERDDAKNAARTAARASLVSSIDELEDGLTPELLRDILRDIQTLVDPLSEFDTREEDFLTARLAARYEETFFDKVTLNEHFILLPNLDDSGEYRMTNELGVTTPLTKSLGLRISLHSEYDSTADESDVDEWDHTLITGLRYEFGKD
jgi:putative salt-induced outer membrane protein YdiY